MSLLRQLGAPAVASLLVVGAVLTSSLALGQTEPSAEEAEPPAEEGQPPAEEGQPPAEEAPESEPTEPSTGDAGDDPDLPKCNREQVEDGPEEPLAKKLTIAEEMEQQEARQGFEGAIDRYALAAQDYQREINLLLKNKVDGHVSFIDKTYGKQSEELELGERQKRTDAVERFERFVQKYPDNAKYTPDAMFRLAELYFERSEVRYADAEEQYLKDRDLYDRGKIPSEPQYPNRDLSDSVRVYNTLLARFGETYRYADAVYYLLGYVLAETDKDEEAIAAWRALVEKFPKSDYAPEVYLRTGEMHFDYGEYELAAAAYGAAMQYPKSRFYDKAIYKLGWTYFQMYDYDRAIRTFKDLIRWYDAADVGGETASALREEAIEYLARSLTEDDWDNDGLDDPEAGVQRALGYLAEGEQFEKDIIREYATSLVELASKKKWLEAIEVYQHLLAIQPLAPDAPEYHQAVVRLYDELGDIDNAAESRKRLAEMFGEDSEWWRLNKDNPIARRLVEGSVEEAMRKRALFHHQTAQQLKVKARLEENPELLEQALDQYRKAAVAYAEYLQRYPNEPTSYDLTFYMAESLWYAGQYAEAAPVYRKVAEDEHHDTYREAAAWSSIKATEKIVETQAVTGAIAAKAVPGSPWTPPESTDESTDLKRVTPEPLPRVVRDWIDTVDFYVAKDMTRDGSRAPQSLIAYQAAETLYRFNHFPEARDRFTQVISCYASEDVAANAAAMIINSYREENDWANLEKWADIATRLKLGNEEQQAEIRNEIKIFKLGSMFKRAEALYEDGKYLEAAREFERLVTENPDAKFADKAFFNAAEAYKKEKYYDSAATIYERLVTDPRYSESEFIEESLFQLAETNKLFFNFDKAITAFMTLYKRYPDNPNRRYALYQTARLQEAMGEYRQAAKTFEQFADTYQAREESAGAIFRAAELYEKISDSSEELRLLKKFVDRFGQLPGMDVLVIRALSRRADLALARKDKKSAERLYKEILREYVARNIEPGKPGASEAAKARYAQIEAEFVKYMKMRAKTASQKHITGLIDKKTKVRDKLVQDYNGIAEYQSYEWLICSATRVADLYKEFADMIYAFPEPTGLTEDELDEYLVMVEDLGLKFENVAINAYETAVEQSRRLKVTNECAQQALASINKFKPAEYPLFKEEKRQTVFEPTYTIDLSIPEGR